MRRLLILTLCAVLLICCLTAVSCSDGDEGDDTREQTAESDRNDGDSETQGSAPKDSDTESDVSDGDTPSVSRSFVGIYDQTVTLGDATARMSGRALAELFDDGTLKIYVCFDGGAQRKTAVYNGRYTAEGDGIRMEYGVGEGTVYEIDAASVNKGFFDAPFYMISSMTAGPVRFYEIAPVSDEGELYVGYFGKTVGANSAAYVYAISLSEGGAFEAGAVRFENGERLSVLLKGTRKETFSYSVYDENGSVTAERDADITAEDEDGFFAAMPLDGSDAYAPSARFIRIN